MTAAELFAIVERWPAEAKPPLRYDWNLHGPKRAKYWYDDDSRLSDTLAELAFIGKAMVWMLEHGIYLTAHKRAGRYVLTASSGDRAIDIGRFDAPTPLEAVGEAVRSVKQ